MRGASISSSLSFFISTSMIYPISNSLNYITTNLLPKNVETQGKQRQRKYVQHKWTPEEDQKLTAAHEKYQGKHWRLIANEIPGRTHKQCRERWCSMLAPNINHEEWTLEEDKIIIDTYEEVGSKWALIAKKLRNRTQNAIKNRYFYLMRRIDKMEKKRVDSELARSHINTNIFVTNQAINQNKFKIPPVNLESNILQFHSPNNNSQQNLKCNDPDEKMQGFLIAPSAQSSLTIFDDDFEFDFNAFFDEFCDSLTLSSKGPFHENLLNI